MKHAAFELKNPIMLAADVDSAEDCLRLARQLEGRIGAIKIGPRLAVRHGAALISELARTLPVFVDNKYLDIPNTMESAVRATFEAGATFATVHCWSGSEALERLAKLELELNRTRPFKILAVTILTSFDEKSLPPGLSGESITSHVRKLANLALSSGITGLVCSPHEVSLLRTESSAAFLVAPGVRLSSDSHGDQKRVETPEAAIRAGASALVIGRPIIEAADPIAAAERMLDSARKGRA